MPGGESDLEELVSEALLITDNIRQAVIEIEHDDGVITLKGTVETQEDSVAAETLARQQEGVVEVVNRLHILGS